MSTAVERALNEVNDGITNVLKGQKQLATRVSVLEDDNRHRKLGFGGSASSHEPAEHYPPFMNAKVLHAMSEQGRGRDVWREYGVQAEHEALVEATRKALDTGTGGSGGGYIVPPEWAKDFIERLRANLVVQAAGAQLWANLHGSPVKIPRQLTSGTFTWVTQNATINKSDASFGELLMTPKIGGMRTQISNLEILLSNPNAEELMRQDFLREAALAMDLAVLYGAGGAEPIGISQIPNIQTYELGTDGGDLDWDHLSEIAGKLEDANALPPGSKGAFLFHPKVVRKLKRLKVAQYSGDTGGAYIVPPLASDATVRDWLGYPFFRTTQIPTNRTKAGGTDLSDLFFCDWSQVVIGLWGNIEILATSIGGDAWAQGSVEVRLMLNMDVQVRHLESILYCSDVKTA